MLFENSKSELQIRDLNITYQGDGYSIKAVNALSLELRQGEILGIAGESGSGKTSICKSLLGMCPGDVRGEVIYRGQNLLENREEE